MAASYRAMLATALSYARGDAASRAAAWRQIVDILAQAGDRLDDDARAHAFAELARIGRDLPVEQRRRASASLAGRVTDIRLIAIFAHDQPAVAAPVLARSSLTDAQWDDVIPALPAASRNILRNRRDLPPGAVRLLGRFAAGDLALPTYGGVDRADDRPVPDGHATGKGAGAGAGAGTGTTRIVDLVERIARYRQRAPVDGRGDGQGDGGDHLAVAANSFAFESDGDGTIVWVEGVARGAIIGLSLAQAAEPLSSGVDAAAVSAWRRRAPLGPSRLLVGGVGPTSGDWTIEAAPLFNPASGRFVGYRGEARRPRAGERAGGGVIDQASGDSVRQLVHELRTPLNAIQGFAAMIAGQMLGPAATAHRAHAREIVGEVERLVALIDDLDLAARLDAGRHAAPPGEQAAVASLDQVIAGQAALLAERDVRLVLDTARRTAGASAIGPGSRIVARLLSAIGATATAGETLSVTLASVAGHDVASIARPAALRGMDTDRLLDPDLGPDDSWPDASLLGLGFTLRLCGRLAHEGGGRLTIGPDAIELSLPPPSAHTGTIAR